jgi:hypothetical protein
MAVVRFSEELKDAIIGNAKALFEQRITERRKAQPDVFDAVYAQAYSTLMPGINALPREFFTWIDNVEVTVKHKGTSISLTGKTAQPYPRVDRDFRTPCGARIKGTYRIEIVMPDTSSIYAPWRDQIIAWQDGIEAIAEQRDEFVDGVKKVINAHSTLAPALKAWPPLWDLVPEAYKERHRKVAERTKAEAPELDVDLTKLTATVVTAKITGNR